MDENRELVSLVRTLRDANRVLRERVGYLEATLYEAVGYTDPDAEQEPEPEDDLDLAGRTRGGSEDEPEPLIVYAEDKDDSWVWHPWCVCCPPQMQSSPDLNLAGRVMGGSEDSVSSPKWEGTHVRFKTRDPVVVTNIIYDTDGEDVELPTTMTVSVEDPDDIPEFISSKVGFLVESYELVDEHRVLTDSEAVDVAMRSFEGMRDNDAFETPPEMLESWGDYAKMDLLTAFDPCPWYSPGKPWPPPDGLKIDWFQASEGTGHQVFCNPPFSQTWAWFEKAVAEVEKGCTVMLLLGAETVLNSGVANRERMVDDFGVRVNTDYVRWDAEHSWAIIHKTNKWVNKKTGKKGGPRFGVVGIKLWPKTELEKQSSAKSDSTHTTSSYGDWHTKQWVDGLSEVGPPQNNALRAKLEAKAEEARKERLAQLLGEPEPEPEPELESVASSGSSASWL